MIVDQLQKKTLKERRVFLQSNIADVFQKFDFRAFLFINHVVVAEENAFEYENLSKTTVFLQSVINIMCNVALFD